MAQLDLLVETDVQVPQRQGEKNNATSTLFVCFGHIGFCLGTACSHSHLGFVHMYMGMCKNAAFSMRVGFPVHMQTVFVFFLMIDVMFCICNVIF